MSIANNIAELIGNTPLLHITKLNPGPGRLYAKLEIRQNNLPKARKVRI